MVQVQPESVRVSDRLNITKHNPMDSMYASGAEDHGFDEPAESPVQDASGYKTTSKLK